METLIAFFIALLITFFFVRRYVKQLAAAQQPVASAGGAVAVGAPMSLRPCPRCSKSIPKSSTFCPLCGAALSIWNIHVAAVQKEGANTGEKGKPKPVINATLCVGCHSCVDVCPETGTLAMVSGKAILSDPDKCTGHAKCVEVCPTQAIVLTFGDALQTVKVPNVKENFETNVPGVFIVGELGGMGLIKTAINEGKLVMDHLRERLKQDKASQAPSTAATQVPSAAAGHAPSTPAGQEPSKAATPDPDTYDVVIVGAGPAGLSASLTAQQYELRYLTLEAGELASTIRQYPRQKFLMAEPVEIPLYGSLYVADGTKETLLTVWETIISNTGVKVRTNEGVQRVQKNGTGYFVETPKGRYHTRFVVMAMGRRGTPRRLGAPGEDLAKVAYRLIEADTYEDQDLLVVGGGDSSIEAALALSRSGKNRVTLCYRGDDFKRARERNQQNLEAAEKEKKLQVFRNTNVAEIREDSVTLDCKGTPKKLPNHFVFVLIGGESPDEFLRKIGIEIVEKAITAPATTDFSKG